MDRGIQDIDVLIRKRLGHIREKTASIEGFYLNVYQEERLRIAIPGDRDDPITLILTEVFEIDAIATVNRDAASLRDEAGYLIPGDGCAASRQFHQKVVRTLDVDSATAPTFELGYRYIGDNRRIDDIFERLLYPNCSDQLLDY